MSKGQRNAALNKGPPQIVAGVHGPHNRHLRAPQDLLEGILYHKLATATLCTTAQNEPTGEPTKRTRHAQDSVLFMKCTEFYEYTSHETLLKFA
jgi:hypothetical protein